MTGAGFVAARMADIQRADESESELVALFLHRARYLRKSIDDSSHHR